MGKKVTLRKKCMVLLLCSLLHFAIALGAFFPATCPVQAKLFSHFRPFTC